MQEFIGRPKPYVGNRSTRLGPNQNSKTPTFDGTKRVLVGLIVSKVSRYNIFRGFPQNGLDRVPLVLAGSTKLQTAVERQQL
jgi:hypothetical protein